MSHSDSTAHSFFIHPLPAPHPISFLLPFFLLPPLGLYSSQHSTLSFCPGGAAPPRRPRCDSGGYRRASPLSLLFLPPCPCAPHESLCHQEKRGGGRGFSACNSFLLPYLPPLALVTFMPLERSLMVVASDEVRGSFLDLSCLLPPPPHLDLSSPPLLTWI